MTEHLRYVEDRYGKPNGTDDLLRILAEGFAKMDEANRKERIAQRGTDKKLNPWVTDAGKCERQVALSLLNIPESDPPDLYSKLRFLSGHAIEDALAEVLTAYQGATFLREEAIAIPAGHTRITGKRDFDSVRLLLNDFILELKTLNTKAMAFRLKNGPQDTHVKQLRLYLKAKKKSRGLLTYWVPATSMGEPVIEAWWVDADDAEAESDIAALARVAEYAEAGIVPPIPEGYSEKFWACRYCPYRTICYDSNIVAALEESIRLAEAANATP